MSEQDVERNRRGVEAFNRGDIEAVLDGLDPQIEWHVPPMLPEQTVVSAPVSNPTPEAT